MTILIILLLVSMVLATLGAVAQFFLPIIFWIIMILLGLAVLSLVTDKGKKSSDGGGTKTGRD